MTQRRRPPLPPEVAAIVRAQRMSGRLSRRSLLGGAGAVSLGALLAACGTGGSTTGSGTSSKPKAAKDNSATDKVVNWANWTLYLDYDDNSKTYPTLQQFQKQTGIKATYSEDIDDNDSYYGKIQAQLKNGQDIGKDVIVFTDWMAARVIGEGYVQKLDKTKMPNSKNILPELADVDFDKGRNYSMTWQSGYAGLAWNKAKIPGGLHSVSDLWKPEYKGKIEVLSEMRDTMGLIMLEQGVDISGAWGADKFENAIAELEKQLNSGQIRQVKGNSYKEDLISGDAVACIAWSGDITQLNEENGNKWEFALPDAGGTLWSDNMLVPIGSPHLSNAQALMNYYYDPEVAAKVTAYVQYICPVQGTQEILAKSSDPDLKALATNSSIFPTEADSQKAHVFRTLTDAEQTKFSSQFEAAQGN
jgi:spermidine/putrescine transport system substrate-binding protein